MFLKPGVHLLLQLPTGCLSVLCTIGCGAVSWGWSLEAIAQVSADDTLTNASTVSFDGTTYEISGGTTNSANLFHSFETFSLSSAETARFNNDGAIDTIIGRVTGGAVSRINGLIEANGDANLFLMNPSGIIFGANAELNIGGSFLATTAERFLFEDDGEFSAANPQDPPLLAINTPIGLQFGTHSGPIRVNGPGNGLFNDLDTFNVVRTERPGGISVPEGETLALVGGKLIFNGGNATASQGRIELGSVGDNETVSFEASSNQWVLSYDPVETFEPIRFVQAASADTSGVGAGSIQIYGQSLRLEAGSAIIASTLGSDNGEIVNIHVSEVLELDGTSVDAEGFTLLSSGVITETALDSTGNGATVAIRAPQLNISGGAQVSATAFSVGNAGNVSVEADEIFLTGISADQFFPSGLFSNTFVDATGQGGNIDIKTDRLFVSDWAEVAATTFGDGWAGNIAVVAEEITVDSNGGLFTSVDTNSQGIGDLSSSGNGGSIAVDVNSLRLDEGFISTTTFSAGDGGNITITAQAVDLTNASLVATDVGEGATGDGGLLQVDAKALSVTSGSQLLTTTAGAGTAGNLRIDANTIELRGFNDLASSGLVASAVIGEGSGGSIQVTAEQLTVAEGATITVGNFGTQSTTPPGSGDSGRVVIDAEVIQLAEGGAITASSLNGLGDVELVSDFLFLNQESQITTNAFGNAAGGNIEIDAVAIAALNNSDISANALEEVGGRVVVSADGIFGTAFRPELTSRSDITASSALGANFSGEVVLNISDVDPSRGLVELPATLVDVSDQVTAACEQNDSNRLVITGAGGMPQNPYQTLQPQSVWADIRLSGDFRHEIRERRSDLRDAINSSANRSEDSVSIYSTHSTHSTHSTQLINEAQSWWINDQGRLVLGHLEGDVRAIPHMYCGG